MNQTKTHWREQVNIFNHKNFKENNLFMLKKNNTKKKQSDEEKIIQQTLPAMFWSNGVRWSSDTIIQVLWSPHNSTRWKHQNTEELQSTLILLVREFLGTNHLQKDNHFLPITLNEKKRNSSTFAVCDKNKHQNTSAIDLKVYVSGTESNN